MCFASRDEIIEVPKQWGKEIILVNEPDARGYCGKIMLAEPGATCTTERHRTKDETFWVVAGMLRLELFGEAERPDERPQVLILEGGDSHRIRPGTWHRFGAVVPKTVFVEFSSYHDDADTEKWTE